MFRPSALRPLARSAFSAPTRTFSTTPRVNLARLTLVGRLGIEPEASTTSQGLPMIKYVIGTSYGPKDHRQTSWFRVVCFPQAGSPQEGLMNNLEKGTLVYVEGDASMKGYEDAEGKKQSSLNIVQRNIEILKRPYREGTPETEEPVAAAGGA